MNKFLWIILLSILIIIVILLCASNYFYNFAILRRKKSFLAKDPDLGATTSGVKWESSKDWLKEKKMRTFNMKSYDNLNLKAINLQCETSTNKTVILVHGYASYGSSMASFAKFYLEELNYNVLMPDCRGHGESEGNYIGFGWHDRKDLLSWINFIIEKNGPNSQIVLHGVSMGGGTVLMTSGETLPSNVKCIISDCSYNSVEGILSYHLKRMFKLPKFPLLPFTSLISKLRAGYFFSEASAVNQVKKSKIPILFIHGSADKFVPTDMIHELYNEASCEKQLLIIDDATHATAFWKDMNLYKKSVIDFLHRHML